AGGVASTAASCREPYAGAETCGARCLSEQQIADHVIACTRAGLQAGFHCIGDDAVAAAVSGLRRAAATLGSQRIRAARHRLEHVEMIADADIATLAELGVVASMQPAFDATWGKPGELYEQRLGPGGAHVVNQPGTFGRARPPTPGRPAVRAPAPHGQPGERCGIRSAFHAATRGGHWAGLADNAGPIRVGAVANLAVWDVGDNGLEGPTPLPRIDEGPLPTCVATMSAGQLIYQSEEFGFR